MLAPRTPVSSTRAVWPNVIRASLGNLVEWFDWFVYAWFAIYFAGAFFPAHDATAQLLSTAVVFAIGFLMRPLGSWVLGLYADRRGRRAALTLSVSLMSAGSLAIALNPGYEAIGIAAPLLLVAARISQGSRSVASSAPARRTSPRSPTLADAASSPASSSSRSCSVSCSPWRR